ncbi:hypothetical protein HELRODRAFT_172160 [Helobdella robusta]|uniref:F5/8 type C domain-containing protein n=1 Tax=Helobdella robusta TaxID=6412 RepID=T1F533_HELRO|nr:hypothetical protein HELRODRAFT_172160 [Helobdella robusta]ESO04513.1 hypothetical protein HELRODRAFT_172160 [Helobdella robusta]
MATIINMIEPGDAHCRNDLGMGSGRIADQHISASSSYDHKSVGPAMARINSEKQGGAWCPRYPVSRDSNEWLEVDLKSLKVVTLVETQVFLVVVMLLTLACCREVYYSNEHREQDVLCVQPKLQKSGDTGTTAIVPVIRIIWRSLKIFEAIYYLLRKGSGSKWLLPEKCRAIKQDCKKRYIRKSL